MFRIINYFSFLFQMSTKRKNRGRVQCQECQTVLNSDQQEIHQKTKHAGQKVKFQIFTGDTKQRKVSAMFSAPPVHSVKSIEAEQGESVSSSQDHQQQKVRT